MLYAIVFILVLVIISPVLTNWVINTPVIKGKISTFIYEKTDYRIESSKFSLSIFPKPSLNVEHLNLNPNSSVRLNVRSLKFYINLQLILKGRLSIDQITIHRPEIIFQALNRKAPSTSSDLSISHYFDYLKNIFTFLPKHQKSVRVKFAEGNSPYFKRLNGVLILEKEKQEITLNSSVENIHFKLSDLAIKGLDEHLNLDEVQVEKGQIKVTIGSNRKLTGDFNLSSLIIKSDNKKTVFNSNGIETRFKISESRCEVNTKPFTINYPKSKVSVHFTNDILQKKSEIVFTGDAIQIDQAREMSLTVFKNLDVTEELFSVLLKGHIPHISVSLQSQSLKTLFNEHNLTLSGNVENANVHIPQTDLIANQVYGAASIKKGVLHIDTSSGMIQTSRIGKGKLTIDLLNFEDFPFTGEFLINADLPMMPATLISLLPDTLLAQELKKVGNVKGKTDAVLKLSMKTGSDDLNVFIQSSDFKASGTYDRIPGDILIDKLNFKLDSDVVTLKNFTGTINNSKLRNVNTMVDIKKDTIDIQSGAGTIDLSAAIPWLMSYKKPAEIISPFKDGSGTLVIDAIQLSGPLLTSEKWKYSISGTGQGIGLTSQANEKQIQNLSCQYQIAHDRIYVHDIQMAVKTLSWLDSFVDKKHYDSIQVPFNVKNGTIETALKNSYLNCNLSYHNGVTSYLELKGESFQSMRVKQIKIADPEMTDASLTFNYNKNNPFIDFEGSLDTHTLKKIIKPVSYWSEKIKESTNDQPILIKKKKDSTFTITAKSFNLTPFVSETELSSPPGRQILPEGMIHFKSDELKYKKIIISNFASSLSFKKDHSYIKINNGLLCDIETKGYINIKKGKVYANFPFRAENKPNIQDLLTCLFQKNDFMDGAYSFKCDLQTASPKKEFKHKLNGTLSFDAKEGRIYKLTLLSRILSVINVSNIFKGKIPNITQHGFAYDSIVIKADVKDSLIQLKEAVIDGQDMTLIFSGWIDPLNDKLNLTCLVAPFKTVDIIIEKIPIINTLLGGRLVSVPAKATGKLSDPTVIPLHPSAVGKGLVDMMGNILKTPVKLWDKIAGEDDTQ